MSFFRQAARTRWPHAKITGDGSWVCLVECFPAKAAKLFHTEEAARAESQKDCGHATCHTGRHTLVRIQEPRQQRGYIPMGERFSDRYERERD